MKKYKVLERHIGEDPAKPYIPGDEETGTRVISATEAKALIELGLIGEFEGDGEDDDDTSETGPADEITRLRVALEDQGATLNARGDEIIVLRKQLDDTIGDLDQSQSALSEVKQAFSNLQAKFDAVSAELVTANETNADLTKQIEASAAKSSAKASAKNAEKSPQGE